MSLDSAADKRLGIQDGFFVVDINSEAKPSEQLKPPRQDSASDQALVEGLGRREPAAIEALYERYGSYVYSMCLRMVRDVQLAEDLTQEVFLRLWRRPDLYDSSRGKFLTWLLSVARNRSIDEQRSRGWRFRFEERPSESVGDMLAAAPAPSSGQDPAVRSDERVVVQRALAALPQEQRIVLQLAYYGGYTQQEISQVLSQPLGTVKTRIRLGLQKLRGILIDLSDRGTSNS